ncbi:MAG TPA: hypothetical protein VFH51_08700, partial [Myxococcota bacterium]|nr:hypothetical protein [Myxococcota bacterium]
VGHTAAGRPHFVGADDRGLSISHADPLCLMITGPAEVGCDLARVEARSSEDWRGLLGDKGFALLTALGTVPMDQAGTHLWAADEALRKGPHPVPSIERLEVLQAEGTFAIFRPQGVTSCLAVTSLVSLPGLGDHVMAIAFGVADEAARTAPKSRGKATARPRTRS